MRARATAALVIAAAATSAIGCAPPEFQYPGAPPQIIRFEVTPFEIAPSEAATVRWRVEGADRVAIDGLAELDGSVAPSGARRFVPTEDAVLTLTADNRDGTRRARASVRVRRDVPVRILEFDVVPDQARSGEPVRVRWVTEGALAVSLRTAPGGAAIEVPASGSRVVRATEPTRVVLQAAGHPAPVTEERAIAIVPAVPIIHYFSPDPGMVVVGTPVRMTIGIEAFERWTLLQDILPTPLVLDERVGDPLRPSPNQYSVALPPLEVGDHDFILRVEGGGRTREAHARVTVVPAGQTRILDFTVTPTVTGSGGEVEVAWRVQDAINVVLVTLGGETSDLPQSGQDRVRIETGQTLRLRAFGRGGQRVDVDRPVRVDTGAPAIVDFRVADDRPGTSTVAVQWEVLGATEVQIDTPDGFSHSSTLATARLSVPVAEVSEIRLTARRSQSVIQRWLTVNRRPPPEILAFQIEASTARVNRYVETSWQVRNATLVTLITANRSERVPARGRRFARVDRFGGQSVVLVADNSSGTASQVRTLFVDEDSVGVEREPNDAFANANGPFAILPSQVFGALAPGDVDVFEVPRRDARLWITAGPTSACPEDLEMEIWRDLGPDGRIGPLVRHSILGVCPELSDATTPELAALEAPFFLILRHGRPEAGITLNYGLRATEILRRCGDGVLDVFEECDDGDIIDGDGCDRACLWEDTDETEPNGALSEIERFDRATFDGSLIPRDEDWLEIVVGPAQAGPQQIELTSPGGGPCALEAHLRLVDPAGAVLADSGAVACPVLTGPAMVLEPGTYRLHITTGNGLQGPRRGRYQLRRSPAP